MDCSALSNLGFVSGSEFDNTVPVRIHDLMEALHRLPLTGDELRDRRLGDNVHEASGGPHLRFRLVISEEHQLVHWAERVLDGVVDVQVRRAYDQDGHDVFEDPLLRLFISNGGDGLHCPSTSSNDRMSVRRATVH